MRERGVVLILDYREPLDTLEEQLMALNAEDQGQTLPAIRDKAGSRRVGIGSQILATLGAHKLLLLIHERRFCALSGFKVEIVDFVPEQIKERT